MFAIIDSASFYAMLIEDWDAFVADQQSTRLALHCAITAYHLHEWVWKDWLKADHKTLATLNIRDLKSFKNWIDFHCVRFKIVQDLANGTKHFNGNVNFKTQHVRGFGRGPFGVGPWGASYLLIDFGQEAGEHRWVPALDLLEVVIRFWRDFFSKYRPDLELPTSVNHLILP